MQKQLVWALAAICLGGWMSPLGAEETVSPPTFERDVRPVLKARCFRCHGEDQTTEGGLDLRLRRFIVAGGDSGPAIVPDKPEESYLLERLKLGEMPPDEDAEQLAPEEIAVIERWIAHGAITARPEPETMTSAMRITEEDRQFWSFQPIRRPSVPTTADTGRVHTPIDAFLLAELEKHDATFATDAGRQTLVRRAFFDLLGLPPAPEEVDRFLADDAPDAWEQLIDRLLASPHYGERWGRHWLDVAGYADSEGYAEQDSERKHAFRFRDYVIRSMNADKPFDRFVREQLAGDEMIEPPYENMMPDEVEKLVATGFLRMAPDGTGSSVPDPLAARDQNIADTIQIVSTSLLGLTLGCARCHNHRYDPISQEDYYRFRAVFEPALNFRGWRTPRQRLISLFTDEDRARVQQIEEEAQRIDELKQEKLAEVVEGVLQRLLEDVPEEYHAALREARATAEAERTAEQRELLVRFTRLNFADRMARVYDREAYEEVDKIAEQAAAIRATKPEEGFARALTEVPGRVPRTLLFARGDYQQPKQAVEPAELPILQSDDVEPIPENDPALPTTGRRLAYARHLTDGSHPLLARVIVNRVWMHHFGRGLCDTPADFGALGVAPSHPELLDWLASEFMESGWSLKRLHRLIMNSTAYRQGLRRDASLAQVDPDNRLLGAMNPRRLEAEIIRDAILAAGGTLNGKQFGPPVPVMPDPIGQFVIGIENSNAGIPNAAIPMQGEDLRRSLYVEIRRSQPLTVMETFDAPSMDPNCERRTASTVAPQSLMLMNSEFVVRNSLTFAERVMAEAGDDPQAQAARAFRLAYSRAASEEELAEATEFLQARLAYFHEHPPVQIVQARQDTAGGLALVGAGEEVPLDPQVTAVAVLCQMLLSSNEFLYVD